MLIRITLLCYKLFGKSNPFQRGFLCGHYGIYSFSENWHAKLNRHYHKINIYAHMLVYDNKLCELCTLNTYFCSLLALVSFCIFEFGIYAN